MYEVYLNPLDSKLEKYQMNGLRPFYLPDSESVCELIKMLPDNVLVSLHDYDFDTPLSIINKLKEGIISLSPDGNCCL